MFIKSKVKKKMASKIQTEIEKEFTIVTKIFYSQDYKKALSY